MATTYSKTAIALQGGGALGAYSFGALKYIYESEPSLQLSSISGVSIGAFTAAIVASHPENPIDYLLVLEGLDRLPFEIAASGDRKVFCLFWQLEFLSATPGLLRFAIVDEFL